MKNTTIIFIITLLLLTVYSENAKADNNSPVHKEQENNIVEDIFKLADDILEFSGDILTLGQKGKKNKVKNTFIGNINPKKQKTSAIGAFSLNKTLNGIGKFLDETGEGIGKSFEGTMNGLGKFLDDAGEGLLEVVEATADVAVVVGVVYLYMIAGSHHYGGHHHYHGYSH